MGTQNDPSNMLATRLCHDLTGPISAINNGVELLEDEELGMQDDAMELIISSAKDASVRLQFFRLVFGHVPAEGETSWHKKREVMEAFCTANSVSIDWGGLPDESCSHYDVRLLANWLLIGSLTLLKSGTIALQQEHNAISIVVSGAPLKVEQDTIAVLNGESTLSPAEPKHIHLWLAMAILAHSGGSVRASMAEDGVSWSLLWGLASS